MSVDWYRQEEDQIHRQPSERAGDKPFGGTAGAGQVPVQIGESKTGCS
jgi:hypothetical protein